MPPLQEAQKLAEVIDARLARVLEMSGDAAVRWPQFARVLVWQMWHLLTGRARRTQAWPSEALPRASIQYCYAPVSSCTRVGIWLE